VCKRFGFVGLGRLRPVGCFCLYGVAVMGGWVEMRRVAYATDVPRASPWLEGELAVVRGGGGV